MAEYQQLSEGRPDGWLLGKAAADKGAFFGGTPVAQQTVTQAATITVSTTITTCAEAILEIYTALSNLGLIST